MLNLNDLHMFKTYFLGKVPRLDCDSKLVQYELLNAWQQLLFFSLWTYTSIDLLCLTKVAFISITTDKTVVFGMLFKNIGFDEKGKMENPQEKQNNRKTFIQSLRFTLLYSVDPCKNVSCDYHAKCSAFPNDTAVCQCMDCTAEPVKPVCGSDMVTYPNECALKAKACKEKKALTVKSIGICRKCSVIILFKLSIKRSQLRD